jgi:L,D-transpeptidase YcbB
MNKVWIILIAIIVVSEDIGHSVYNFSFPSDVVEWHVDSTAVYNEDLFAPNMVKEFYRRREFRPAWIVDQTLTSISDSLLLILHNASAFGLISEEYHVKILDSIMSLNNPGASLLLQSDVLLTDAFLKLSSHVKNGRLLRQTVRRNYKTLQMDSLLLSTLNHLLSGGSLHSLISTLEPSGIQYRELRSAYNRKLNVYQRDLLSEEERMYYYAELIRMAVNLERWRWEKTDLGPRYIYINIPSYALSLVENGKEIIRSKVIVGLPDKPTPPLSSNIECIVIYPYWNVPRSIATKELLPIIKKNPHYLQSNHFDILDHRGKEVNPDTINWNAYSTHNFPFQLRQREGEDNALGVIKFQFDNKYGVYLHDTNARYLFKKEMRALSHGCIRVEKAVEIAHNLVQYDSGKTSAAHVDQFLNTHQRREINLKKEIPIHVRYITADKNGLYRDVYDRDEELMVSFKELLNNPLPAHDNFYLRHVAQTHENNHRLRSALR